MPTSPRCALTPSSTRRIVRCSAAAAWMARSIARPARVRAKCRTLHGCKTGDAKITRGYRLPAHHVIHAVGPVWHGGGHSEDALLASCYRRAIELCRTWPRLGGVSGHLHRHLSFSRRPRRRHRGRSDSRGAGGCTVAAGIIFCCFSNDSARLHAQALAAFGSPCAD